MANLQILILILIGLCLRFVVPQRFPPNGCRIYFQYEWMKDHWIGHITPNLTNAQVDDVDWKVEFCWDSVSNSGSVSHMEPYPPTVLQRRNGLVSGEVLVHFDDFQEVLPKITLIEFNGQELCTTSPCENESSGSTATREMRMTLSSSNGAFATATASSVAWVESHSGGYFSSSPPARGPKKPLVIVESRQHPGAAECGVEGFSALQIGGQRVSRGQFPWLAALYHDTSLDPSTTELTYKCVSTLISARTVITAAHCIYGLTPAQLRVYVGRHDVTVHPEKDATLMAVESVKPHPDFNGNLSPDSDVGLLVLTEPVRFSANVRPICLWSSSSSWDIDDSEKMIVAGWGSDGNSAEPTSLPMRVEVRPVSREECLREMITAKDFLTYRTLCAGNSQGHGPCLGDSGGGLMVLRNNRWVVRGIVSVAQRVGDGCDLSRFAIYCDVAWHLGWIERNIVR
ncbi:hypothetical protein ACLKA6_000504 [Drosophila palustris]